MDEEKIIEEEAGEEEITTAPSGDDVQTDDEDGVQ